MKLVIELKNPARSAGSVFLLTKTVRIAGGIFIGATILGLNLISAAAPAAPPEESSAMPESASFQLPVMWEYTAPLIAPERRLENRSRAQKDPTVVYHGGKWHVFMTVKLPGRSAIEYCSFRKWADANRSGRTILDLSDSDYYCAAQVFYFEPHEKWYLVYQMGVPGAQHMWVAYSTTTTISDPNSWTRAKPILDAGEDDPREVGGARLLDHLR